VGFSIESPCEGEVVSFDAMIGDETDGKVNPIFPAMGPNVAGVIGSAVAAGVFLTLFS